MSSFISTQTFSRSSSAAPLLYESTLMNLEATLKLHYTIFFISTRDQMTMCNVKGVAFSDKPTEHYHPTEHISIFQLTVLVTALINFISSCSRQPFSAKEKPLINPLHTVFPVPNGKQMQLATSCL